jgi:putative hemolysin
MFHRTSALGPTLLILAGLLLLSAVFSGSETALFSLTRVQRERLKQRGSKRDRLILDLLSQPRRLILTILIANELVNISFDALITQAGHVLGGHRLSEAMLALLCTAAALPSVVILGEIVPKSIAMIASEQWARLMAPLIRLVEHVATPVRVVLRAIGDRLVNLIAPAPAAPRPAGLREDEFRAMVDVVSEEGEVGARERNLIHNVFEFGDRTVGSIMTPADKVYALAYDLPMPRLSESVLRGGFSRIPIYRGRRDNIVGVLHAKQLVGFSQGLLKDRPLKDLLQPVYFVPKQTKCDRLFRDFQRRRSQLALVVDEYGKLAGLVTMEDLLEELFGEIRDEKERPRRLMQTPPRGVPLTNTAPAHRDGGPDGGRDGARDGALRDATPRLPGPPDPPGPPGPGDKR